jgi:NAD(P)-dependent dehydrogenase (short-subunit alcohol dehydrogenase family)
MAVELCKFGITVNMISPGLMATTLTAYLPSEIPGGVQTETSHEG